MVGAIADWFAVTALFKHPLGLPIPHTALIPKRKDELGRGLEEFVGENFLQEAIIRDRLAAAGVVAAARGVALPSRRTRSGSSTRWRRSRRSRWRKVRDEHIESLVRDALTPRFREEPISPLLGGLLSEALRDDLHHGLVDLALDRAARVAGREPGHRRRGPRASGLRGGRRPGSTTRSPAGSTSSWSAGSPTSATTRGTGPAGAGLGARASSPRTCCTTPTTQARAEALKERLLDHPAVDLVVRSRCGTRCAAP